eukprot:TRINITY_DN12695_c0_g1_i16.p1 TRINITY_DN12695_c0_g1~~TRINITY_DN12695_c0_g1_i16.p1  ORF type:complete len:153 (-),score=19.57 TRINITY_DN12695_c0_g1_i16:52-510(-)
MQVLCDLARGTCIRIQPDYYCIMQMILPEFRQSSRESIVSSFLAAVNASSGSNASQLLNPIFVKLQQLRDEIIQIPQDLNDIAGLEGLIARSKEYLAIWDFTCKKLSLSAELALPAWHDSLAGKELPGSSKTERLSVPVSYTHLTLPTICSV